MSRALLLDVMGTLVHDPFYEEMPRFFGMSLAELIEAKHPSAWIEFEHGRWTQEQFLASFFADGRAFDHAGFMTTMAQSYRFLPGIEPLLVELSERGVPMHVLSNYPAWYRLIEERLGLSRFVRWTFVSCEIGLRKPDPELFAAVIDRVGLPCTFVDDREDNCVGAGRAGIDAIRFESAESLREALSSRGLV